MKISILGTGSWGTALAKVLVENQQTVVMWGRDEAVVNEINTTHTIEKYLPNIALSNTLTATTQLSVALADTDAILIVVPTKAMREVVTQVKEVLQTATKTPIIIHATKGLEPQTHLRMTQVIAEVLPAELYEAIVVLSGPSHAEEVARKDLTTITASSDSLESAKIVQQLFMNEYFRVYTNQDVLGVELGAALKNIIAIGAGLLVGLGYGDNAKAGLVTRGLAEITRLGVKLGADPITFLGLSGVGDLVVTCTSPHSRNWQAGNLLAKGYSRQAVESIIEMVVEGITTTAVAHELAIEQQVEMPITAAIYAILYENETVEQALKTLMAREGKHEADFVAYDINK